MPTETKMWRLPYLLIQAYRRLVSPLLPPTCRFHPSCSRYAVEALRRHGLARGGWLALRRVARCHPWHAGGLDPVPPTSEPEDGRTARPFARSSFSGEHADG